MRYVWIGLILYLAMLLEGAAMPWLLPDAWSEQLQMVPNLVMVGVVFTAVYLNRYAALAYGLLFGLLQDIVYGGHMMGPHCFSMGLIGYAAGLIARKARAGIWQTLFLVTLFSLLYDMALYETYTLFRVIDIPFQWNLTRSVLPGLGINLVVAAIFHASARRLLARFAGRKESEETRSSA